MEIDIPEDQLARFSDFVAESTGLHFPPARWPDLRRAIAATAGTLGYENAADCVRQLMSAAPSAHQLEALAGHLTIGETYFFRDVRTFELLTSEILPSLVRAKQDDRRLRIWSAGCCSGEEIYSIAIALRRTIPDLDNWNVTLLATDLNPNFLRKGEAGVFSAWSFRDAPAWLKESYFRPAGAGQFGILPEIRRMVRFAQLNLAEDTYPSLTNGTNAMDVIFCRNVLMYFTPERARQVIDHFYRAQVEGGWLVMSPSEHLYLSTTLYKTIVFSGSILYRKQRGSPHEPPERPAPRIDLVTANILTETATVPLATVAIEPVNVAYSPESDVGVSGELEIKTLYENGYYAEAADKLVELLLESPNDASALSLLTRSLANQGKLTEALASCERWITANKLDPSAYYVKALVLQEQGALEEAVRSLHKTLYLEPQFALAHLGMGHIARSSGRFDDAQKYLNTAIEILRGHGADEVLPEAEGVRAGRLIEMISALLQGDKTK